MTPKKDSMDVGRRPSPPVHTPRLRLKPKAPQSGYVDGAWWPHSEDLTAELPDLLSVLSVRLGWIGRVIYNVNDGQSRLQTSRQGGERYDSMDTASSRSTPSKSSGLTATKSSYS